MKSGWKTKERKRRKLVTEKLKKCSYRPARAERESTEQRQKRLDRKRQQTAEKRACETNQSNELRLKNKGYMQVLLEIRKALIRES